MQQKLLLATETMSCVRSPRKLGKGEGAERQRRQHEVKNHFGIRCGHLVTAKR